MTSTDEAKPTSTDLKLNLNVITDVQNENSNKKQPQKSESARSKDSQKPAPKSGLRKPKSTSSKKTTNRPKVTLDLNDMQIDSHSYLPQSARAHQPSSKNNKKYNAGQCHSARSAKMHAKMNRRKSLNQQEQIWRQKPELMAIPIPRMDELPLSLRLHTNPMLLAQSLRNQYLLNKNIAQIGSSVDNKLHQKLLTFAHRRDEYRLRDPCPEVKLPQFLKHELKYEVLANLALRHQEHLHRIETMKPHIDDRLSKPIKHFRKIRARRLKRAICNREKCEQKRLTSPHRQSNFASPSHNCHFTQINNTTSQQQPYSPKFQSFLPKKPNAIKISSKGNKTVKKRKKIVYNNIKAAHIPSRDQSGAITPNTTQNINHSKVVQKQKSVDSENEQSANKEKNANDLKESYSSKSLSVSKKPRINTASSSGSSGSGRYEVVTYTNVVRIPAKVAKTHAYDTKTLANKQMRHGYRKKVGIKLITALPCYFQKWDGSTPKEQANKTFVSRFHKEIV